MASEPDPRPDPSPTADDDAVPSGGAGQAERGIQDDATDGTGDGPGAEDGGESRVPQADDVPSVREWVETAEVETTADIDVPDSIIQQVIGQEHAVQVVRKAVEQKRHVMMLGDPGTGKSMLAQAMAEMMPSEELEDVMVYHNPEDEHAPRVRTVPAGKGKEIVNAQKREANKRNEQRQSLWMLLVFGIMGLALFYFISTNFQNIEVIFFGIIAVAMLMFAMRYVGQRDKAIIPKLLVTHQPGEMAPFEDATGAHAGALLGDVRHDPFQSGGLETPAHERVEPGAIHKANHGVLFVDEINMLRQESQQSLLTALQEREFPIMGQSERSSGAMVKTEPVPCNFILVAAGNLDAIPGMHPALRSRIRGYGYEVYMDSDMDDTPDNRTKLIRFIAQEVKKDGKIPHYDRSGIVEIVREAQRRAGRQGKLTLRLRELGGLVRVAGDIAHERGVDYVSGEHVLEAKQVARSLEQQVVDKYIEKSKDYLTFRTTGEAVGQVNGLAVRGIGGQEGVGEPSGIVLPIVAEVTPAQKRDEGQIIATGKLGEIAKEAVQNVSAVVKKYTGTDITTHDVHIQFIGTYEGVEGDSASISVATAVISAMEDVPVDQRVAMTGSLSVRGTVLPVGGVTPKIEAAARAGIKKVLIPKMNMNDVLVEEKYRKQVEIVPVETLKDVLTHALVGPDRDGLIAKLAKLVPKPKTERDPPRPAGDAVPG